RAPTFEATPRTQRAWLGVRRATLQPRRKPSRWWVADRDLGGGKGVRRAKAQDTDSKGVTAVRQSARPGEPHSGGRGRENRKDRPFLNLRIPYFPYFTHRTPHFPQILLSFLPFPTLSYLKRRHV